MVRIRIFVAVCLATSFVACSTFQKHKVADEKDFNVPAELANKFEVKSSVGAPKAAAPQAAQPVAGEKKKAKGVHARKSVKEKGKPEVMENYPKRWQGDPLFKVGERYVFDITYFGATAGELSLQIMPFKYIGDRKVFHIEAHARTSSVFSLFYRMNDTGESYIDADGLFSFKFQMKMDQSLLQRDLIELYDQKAHKLYYYSKMDHKTKGFHLDQYEAPIEPFTQDGLSAFYYLRTLPLEVGMVKEFPVVTNGKLRTVRVTVVRKEKLVTKAGDFEAFVIKPEVVLEGVMKTEGDSFIWISADEHRSLLKVDAKIKVGKVIAYLREMSYGSDAPQAASR